MPSGERLAGWLALALSAVAGANVGSFLNVVAHRLPQGLSVVRPRSRCPACRTPIRAADNVPVLSWLLLGGRCRGCAARISPRYPAVELFTAALAAHVVWTLVVFPGSLGEPRAWLHAGVVFVVASALVAASLIDADHRILPDSITKPGMWAAPAVAAFVPEVVLGARREVPGWVPEGLPLPVAAALVSAAGIAVGACVVYGLGWLGTRVFGKEAMGFGDVKFLGMIGGFTGPWGALVALVAGAVVGAAVGLVRLAITRDRYIPFGPFLALGGYLALLYGTAPIEWYLDRVSRSAGG